jgi:transcriptional regulator with GAF, ATPase, and Fis domain
MCFGPDAVAAIQNYEWPGNVRELQNRVQRAVLVQTSETITAADLGLAASDRRAETPRRAPPPGFGPPPGAVASTTLPDPRLAPGDAGNERERAAIDEALVRAGGVVANAAAEMGLSRQAPYRRMERRPR